MLAWWDRLDCQEPSHQVQNRCPPDGVPPQRLVDRGAGQPSAKGVALLGSPGGCADAGHPGWRAERRRGLRAARRPDPSRQAPAELSRWCPSRTSRKPGPPRRASRMRPARPWARHPRRGRYRGARLHRRRWKRLAPCHACRGGWSRHTRSCPRGESVPNLSSGLDRPGVEAILLDASSAAQSQHPAAVPKQRRAIAPNDQLTGTLIDLSSERRQPAVGLDLQRHTR